jgi:hypothetical protein
MCIEALGILVYMLIYQEGRDESGISDGSELEFPISFLF